MKKFVPAVVFLIVLILSCTAQAQVTSDPPFPGDTAGSVNGRVLTRKAYTDIFADLSRQQEGKKPRTLSQQELIDIHRKTWDQLVMGAIIDGEIEKRGITISEKEARSVLENNPPEFIKNAFVDSSGIFHRQEYLQALHDPRNDTIVHSVIESMKIELRKKKFADTLLSLVTVTDDELWQDYKKQKDVTREKFEKEKDGLREKMLAVKQQAFISSWLDSSRAKASIIDYRTIK
jgi:hypothetical protein